MKMKMNPASLFISSLEENHKLAFIAVFVCFMFFYLYDDIIKRNNRVHAVSSTWDNDNNLPNNEDLIQVDKERKEAWEDEESPFHGLKPAIPEDIPHKPYNPGEPRSDTEMIRRSKEFYELMNERRSVRFFSREPVPQEVLNNIIKTAGTSPSGAHTEPWTFVLVQDEITKQIIRDIVEDEEFTNYTSRMSRQWVTDLKPLKTEYVKPYLTDAPALVLVFRQTHSYKSDGQKKMHYYSETSVAIAAGILLAAIQYAGLVTLTSTPLNCGPRISSLLTRPSNERLALLLPVGRPHPQATVPDLRRKSFEELIILV